MVPRPTLYEQVDKLSQAQRAIRRGNYNDGMAHLSDVLDQDPGCVPAWLWATECVEDRYRKIECLRRVLAYDPHNEVAQAGMRALIDTNVHSAPFVDGSFDPLTAEYFKLDNPL